MPIHSILQPILDGKINKNTDTTALLPDSANRRYMTDAQKSVMGNTTGNNTGDQDLSGLVPKTTTVNGKVLSANISLAASDVGAPAGSGTSTGTNTGDQAIPAAQIQSDWTQTNTSLADFIKNKPARSFNNAPGRSIVTSTGAVGFQPSATRDCFVCASMGLVTTSSIGSGQDGYIVMEIAPTNSSIPSDWLEIGRIRNGQIFTLAIAIQGVQTIAGDIARIVPAGYYVKYRAVNVTGTPPASWISGQEVLLK